MNSLLVTARLDGTPRLAGRWPLMLDSLLTWAVQEQHDRHRHLVDCGPLGECRYTQKEPQKAGGGTRGRRPRHLAIREDRFGRPLANSMTQLHNPRFVPREYRLPLGAVGDPQAGDEWWWQCSRAWMDGQTLVWRAWGERGPLLALLDSIEVIGGVGPQGDGIFGKRVLSWGVDHSAIAINLDGPHQRPIPSEDGSVKHGIRPPYWHPAQERRCIRPERSS